MGTLYTNRINATTSSWVTVDDHLRVVGDLQVTGTLNAKVTDFVVSANSTTLGDASSDTVVINAGTVSIPNNLNFDSNTLVLDSSNNRVGVGTASPSEKVDIRITGSNGGLRIINEADNAYLKIDAPSDEAAYIDFSTSGSNDWQIGRRPGSNDLTVYDNDGASNYIFTWRQGGNVGIGTLVPTHTLSVTGTLGVSGSATFENNVQIKGLLYGGSPVEVSGGFSVTSGDLIVDTTTLKVDSTNNRVGIGTAVPEHALSVSGTLGVTNQLTVHDTTTTSANAGSKIRLSANDGAPMGDSHRLGVVEFTGAEDSSGTQVVGARIEALTDAAWTNAENGCALYFYTTDGNASQSNVLKLDSNKKATFSGEVVLAGTTPKLTIGDAGAEDTMLVFDGNAADFRVGLDDGTDALEIGVGSAHGTTTAISVNSSGQVATFTLPAAAVAVADDHLVILDGGATGAPKAESVSDLVTAIAGTASATGLSASSGVLSVSDLHAVGVDGSANQLLTDDGDGTLTSEAKALVDGAKITIGNATAEDAMLAFDGNAQDFHIALDDSADDLVIGVGTAAGTTTAIAINENAQVQVVDAFAANTGGTFGTFADGDATPSVATGNLWKHHASSQTITMFDDGIAGQTITVLSTAAITYDVTSTNLKGGSTDIVTADGDLTTWTFDGTNWYLQQFMDASIDMGAAAGDITGVTAGVGLSGGGSSGDVTLTLDLSELSDVTPANGDKLATLDSDGSTEQLTTVANLATLFAGTGLTATNSVIAVDAAQAISSVSGDLAVAGDVTVTGGDIVYGNAQDATLGVTATAHNTAGKPLTISAGPTTAGTTNNIAGGSLTIAAGQGKGSGAGGDIVFKTANAGSTGSSLNALATALTISDDLSSTFSGNVVVGSDGSGYDVTFHSATSGDSLAWDASEEKLTITGTNGQTALAVADGNATFADNVTVTGDLGVSGACTFASTVGVATSLNPDASDGATLGTTALEWSDLYLADGANIFFGDGQDVTLTHNTATTADPLFGNLDGLVINTNEGSGTGTSFPLVLSHTCTGSVAAGFGVGLAFTLEGADGDSHPAASIATTTVDPDNTEETYRLNFATTRNGDAAPTLAASLGRLQGSASTTFTLFADDVTVTEDMAMLTAGTSGDLTIMTMGNSSGNAGDAHVTINPDGDIGLKPKNGDVGMTYGGNNVQGLNFNLANVTNGGGHVMISNGTNGTDIRFGLDAASTSVLELKDGTDHGSGHHSGHEMVHNVQLTSFGTGLHRVTADVDIRAAHSGDNSVIVELTSALKIPAHAIIRTVGAVVKTASNLGTHKVNIQMSATSGTGVDSSISSGTELLGAGSADAATISTDVAFGSTSEDIDLVNDAKKVSMCTTFVRNGSSDQFLYICNAGTGNGTTNSSSGTLTVVVEYMGMD